MLGRQISISALGTLLLASACSASETGPALTEDRRVLRSETEISELVGFSLDQVLPAEPASAQLKWLEGRAGVEFLPAVSTSVLRWSLILPPRSSSVFRIEQVDVQCDTARFVTNTPVCDDRLEAALNLHLETGDGALAEDIPVVFKAFATNYATWENADLDVASFAGSFEISAQAQEPGTFRLGAFGTITEQGSDGVLLGNVLVNRAGTGESGSTEGAVVTVAEWHSLEHQAAVSSP